MHPQDGIEPSVMEDRGLHVFAPVRQANIDFKEDDRDEQDQAQRDLDPLVPQIVALDFDEVDAPGQER